uniref:Putative secreted protein n=1 Tax=Lutzomyia longipalpis TaxID=7200 RepID=A0A1B0CV18_LUTLO
MKQLQIWAIVLLHAIAASPIQFPDDRRQQSQQRSLSEPQERLHSYHNVNDLFSYTGTRYPKRRRKPFRKHPCLPHAYSRQAGNYLDEEPDENVNSKFLGFNLFLTDVDVDGVHYNPFGGYPCSPGLTDTSGHRPQKPHRPHRPQKPLRPEKPDKPVVEDYDEVIIDDVSPDKPDTPERPSRPGGGPLGFFGEGGLFDLSNFGGLNRPGSLFNTLTNLGSRPALTGGNVLGDSVDSLQKPLIEINVPDAINGLRTGNWNARQVFGDVLDSFSSLTSLIFGGGS